MKRILLIIGAIITFFIATITSAIVFFNTTVEENGNHQVITIAPEKSIVFSLSKKIDKIEYNRESGFSIRTLEGGVWIDMSNNPEDYTPMKGYIIRNNSNSNLQIDIYSKNITDPNETLFQHTLKAGWNLVGPAYKNDEYKMVNIFDMLGNSNYSHIADFTGDGYIKEYKKQTYTGEAKIFKKQTYSGEVKIDYNTAINHLIKGNTQIKNKNELTNLKTFEGLAYGVFVPNDTIIPGSQNLSEIEDINKRDIFVMSYISNENDKFGIEKNTAQIKFNVTGLKNYDKVFITGLEITGGIEEIKNDSLENVEFIKEGNLYKLKTAIDINNGSVVTFKTNYLGENYINKIYYKTYKSDGKIYEVREEERGINLGEYSSECNGTINNLGFCEEEENISLNTKQINFNNRELVIGNGVETVLIREKLTANGGNYNFNEYKIIPTSYNSLSNNLKIDDIIETSTLNIGGETFNGNVTGSGIIFNFNKELLEGQETELIVTATLQKNDNIINGDILSLNTENNIMFQNISNDIGETNDYNKTILLKNGSASIDINNNTVFKDEIKETVLAGTNGVFLAGLNINIKDEDMNINKLIFNLGNNNLSNNLKNVKIIRIEDGKTIAENGYLEFTGDKTILTFDNFTIENDYNTQEMVIVTDLSKISDNGQDTLVNPGKLKLKLLSANIVGMNSNDIIISELGNTESSVINIIPAIVNGSVDNQFGTSDNISQLGLIIDKGNNIFNDDIVIKSFEFNSMESANTISEIKNYNQELMIKSRSGSFIEATNGVINNGDQIEFKSGTGGINAILKSIKYSIGQNDYITNFNEIDLGTYTE